MRSENLELLINLDQFLNDWEAEREFDRHDPILNNIMEIIDDVSFDRMEFFRMDILDAIQYRMNGTKINEIEEVYDNLLYMIALCLRGYTPEELEEAPHLYDSRRK